ncbi:MAG: hypothetical protein M3271_12610, partial [Actinomycetota bacterium]|nr:hypothetical protein [Actinomycetota bacterium]
MVSFALLAAACSDPPPTASETAAPRTPAPTKSAPVARAGRCVVPDRAAPPEAKPHYSMRIEISPGSRSVTGTSEVRFVAERAVRRLVFRLWPNGPRLASAGTALVVEEARLTSGDATVERPDPTTLVFDLDERLSPGESADAVMQWRLDLPGAVYDRISQNGNAVRLGSFFPILSWEGERGWATDAPTTTLAESSTSPTADFDVEITVPPGLDVIGTGEEGPGRWEARDVRDFAVAAAEFDVVRETVDAPRPVEVTVGVAAGLDADPREFRDAISRALRDLSGRYGDYPWSTFSMAIMPDLERSGIEYPSMVFQGDGSLRTATTHEVAHSWFYGLVGNNQARDP